MNYNKYRVTSAAAYPENLQLEVSRACTLACTECRRTRLDPRGGGSLADEILEKLEPVIAQADMLDVSGWGEPLGCEAPWKIFEIARWSRTNACLTTNGTQLTDANCRQLVERQVGQVTISLDAGTPEGFGRLRPGAELEEVTGGIWRLARMREALGSATPFIVVAFNFHESSAAEFPAFVRLAAKLPVYKAVVHPCFPQGRGKSASAICEAGGYGIDSGQEHERMPPEGGTPELSAECRRYFETGMVLAEELGLKIDVFLQAVLDTQLGIGQASGEEKYYLPSLQDIKKGGLFPTCRCAWDFPFIDQTGNVFPCNNYPTPMGSLVRNNFEEIWDNAHFNRFRHNLVTHQPDAACLACRKTMWYPNRMSDLHAEHLALSSDGLVGLGWYPAERIGKGDFRWSRGTATVYLHNGRKPKLYFVASALRETRINVAVEGREVGTLKVGNYWEVCSIDLPAFEEMVLRVSFTCPDAQGDPASAMPRHRMRLLGIAVSQIGMCFTDRDEEPRRALKQVQPRSFPMRLLKDGIGRWMKMLFMS